MTEGITQRRITRWREMRRDGEFKASPLSHVTVAARMSKTHAINAELASLEQDIHVGKATVLDAPEAKPTKSPGKRGGGGSADDETDPNRRLKGQSRTAETRI
jgi:hypothetical protein